MRLRTSVVFLVAICLALPLIASAPTGAIFTTVADGSEVNANIYASKDLVYLDGGPGPGAPQTAAGLDDARYVFQVTDPSGKSLLSQDKAICRQFDVANGIITNVVVTGCEHKTGLDIDHGATTVQLMPYANTPNNGGEYKAWATKLTDFLAGCAELGVSNGLNVIDCGTPKGGNFHGFVASDSKTDNFKTKVGEREIDTYYKTYPDEIPMDGVQQFWIDTLGVKNNKYSYNDPAVLVNHASHIEAIENGVHYIGIFDQPGCKVVKLALTDPSAGATWYTGAQTLGIRIKSTFVSGTYKIDVWCAPN